jgi:hypothetical protein
MSFIKVDFIALQTEYLRSKNDTTMQQNAEIQKVYTRQ